VGEPGGRDTVRDGDGDTVGETQRERHTIARRRGGDWRHAPVQRPAARGLRQRARGPRRRGRQRHPRRGVGFTRAVQRRRERVRRRRRRGAAHPVEELALLPRLREPRLRVAVARCGEGWG
jgi:hypothetical protein